MIVRKELLATAVLLLFSLSSAQGSDYISACYYTSWSADAAENIQLPVKDIDAGLCTHIIYAFGKFDTDSLMLVPSNPAREDSKPGSPGLYEQFNDVKKRNGNLRTILSIGGQNELPSDFAKIAKDQVSITKIAKNAAEFLRKRGFDGLDVDWEYPAADTKAKYVDLLKGLREAFDQEATESGQRRLLLTVAVPAGKQHVDPGFDVPNIVKYVDYIFLMSYDYAGKWTTLASFNSPLKKRDSVRFSPANNVEYSVKLWLDKGTPKSKLVVGMTGAGVVLTLSNPNNHAVGADLIKGGGQAGTLFASEGRLIYPEICNKLKSGWTRAWDAEQVVPYAYSGNQWVGYDDKESIKAKAQYITEQKLGGAMFWELSFDDPFGKYCNEGNHPLLNVVKTTLGIDDEMTTTTTATAAATTTTTTTTAKPVVRVAIRNDKDSGATASYDGKLVYIVIGALICAIVN